MRFTKRLILPLAALIMSGCNPAAKAPEPEVKKAAVAPASAIEAINKAKELRRQSLSSGNIENYLSVYADDAVVMPPHSGEIVGKDLARIRLKQVLDQVTVETTTLAEEMDVQPDGVLVVDRGRYASSSTTKSNGVTRADGGNYIILWKRNAAGEYKIAYEMWTSKAPLAGDAK